MSEFTAKLEQALTERVSKVEITIQAAKDLPEIGDLYITIEPGELRVDLPFTEIAYEEYRKALGDKWRKMTHTWQTDDGDRYFSFDHVKTGVLLVICLDATSDFATCKRIRIGMKEVPIFETVCQ